MSEDTTKDLPKEPSLREVLEAINTLGVEFHQFRVVTEKRFENLEIRMDKMHGEIKETHSELYALRAEFRELRAEFYEFRSQFKQPA
jgi:uncharacterized protein (DUF111 family)